MFWQVPLAIVSGVPVGFQLGATGAGGALLAVPLLVYIVGVSVQEATAMSLVIVAASSVLGTWEYARIGDVKISTALAFSATGMGGAWLGAYGHRLVRPEVLLVLFGVLLLLARALMIRQARAVQGLRHPSGCALTVSKSCCAKLAVIGFGVGLLNGFFGVGGGFMIVTALVLIADFPQRLAKGTALLVIALISIGGIAGHLQFGTLNSVLTLWLVLGSSVGMLLGTRVEKLISQRAVRRVTASITVSIALTLIVVNLTRLVGHP